MSCTKLLLFYRLFSHSNYKKDLPGLKAIFLNLCVALYTEESQELPQQKYLT